MGRPFSQQPPLAGPALAPAVGVVAPPAVPPPPPALVPPPPPVVVAVVAVDDGDRAPGLSAPADDMAGDVAVVGWPPLTRS